MAGWLTSTGFNWENWKDYAGRWRDDVKYQEFPLSFLLPADQGKGPAIDPAVVPVRPARRSSAESLKFPNSWLVWPVIGLTLTWSREISEVRGEEHQALGEQLLINNRVDLAASTETHIIISTLWTSLWRSPVFPTHCMLGGTKLTPCYPLVCG